MEKQLQVEKMLQEDLDSLYKGLFKSFKIEESYLEIKDSKDGLYRIPYRTTKEDYLSSDAASQKLLVYSVLVLGDLLSYKVE